MSKITYANKVAINENASIPNINKVTDDDMNEIKNVVNNNDDEMITINNKVTKLTNATTYSTDETVIGKWINNKPLYRKVLTGTLPTGSGENTFNFSGINIINFYGEIKATSGATFLINTYYTPITAYSISSWIDNSGNLKIECGSNYNTSSQYEIVIEYTKTID